MGSSWLSSPNTSAPHPTIVDPATAHSAISYTDDQHHHLHRHPVSHVTAGATHHFQHLRIRVSTMTASKHATETTAAAAATVGAAGAGITKAATGLAAGAAGVAGAIGSALTGVGAELVHDTGRVLGGAAVTAKAAGQTVVGGAKTATAAVAGTERHADDGSLLPGYGRVTAADGRQDDAAGARAVGASPAGDAQAPPPPPVGAFGAHEATVEEALAAHAAIPPVPSADERRAADASWAAGGAAAGTDRVAAPADVFGMQPPSPTAVGDDKTLVGGVGGKAPRPAAAATTGGGLAEAAPATTHDGTFVEFDAPRL